MPERPTPEDLQVPKIGFSPWDAITALTLAHLIMLPIWELAIGDSPRLFFLDESIGLQIVPPLLTATGLLAVLGYGLLRLLRRGHAHVYLAWICLALLGGFSFMRSLLFSSFARNIDFLATSGRPKALVMAIWLLLLISAWRALGTSRWIHLSQTTLRILSPLMISIWASAFMHHLHARGQVGAQGTIRDSRQTVWVLIFDELDQQLAMESEAAKNFTTEFRSWRSFTFHGTQAFPTSNATLFAIPSLIQGRLFGESPLSDEYEFSRNLISTQGRSRSWDWHDSLFTDVRRSGGQVSVVGWAFPYAPMYGHSLDRVRWISVKAQDTTGAGSPNFRVLLSALFKDALLGPVVYTLMSAESRSRAHRHVGEQVQSWVSEVQKGPLPDLGWIHFPIPHAPSVAGAQGTYLDNLGLADQRLRAFRETLEQRGRWEEATVVVLGDHWFRIPVKTAGNPFIEGLTTRWNQKDHRVPFFLKLPNQRIGLTYTEPFNTVILRQLVGACRSGEIQTYDQAATWIGTHSPFAEAPGTRTAP